MIPRMTRRNCGGEGSTSVGRAREIAILHLVATPLPAFAGKNNVTFIGFF